MRDVPIGRNALAAVAPINFAARRREIVSCIVRRTLTITLVGQALRSIADDQSGDLVIVKSEVVAELDAIRFALHIDLTIQS
jgi:hypothetical protein